MLGDFAVFRGGEAATLPPSKKTRALLAYLALADRPVRRERLCEMFWELPDDPRGSLRWSLSKIRSIVNSEDSERLIADRNSVELDDRDLTIDVRSILDAGKPGVASTDPVRMEEIATIPAEGFLQDLALPNCPTFEAWRIALADEVRDIQMRNLRALINRNADDLKKAQRYANMLLMLCPNDNELAEEIAQLRDQANKTAPPARAGDDKQGTGSDEPVSGQTAVALQPSGADEQEIRHCQTRDGVRLAYTMTGSGPVIVRSAHWMSDLKYDWNSPLWQHWIKAFTRDHTLVRYDQRGCGLSDRNVSDFTFDAMLADLESIIDAVGQRRVILLGLSQGCAVCGAYAARHPERVSGMILFGSYVKGWRKTSKPIGRERFDALVEAVRRSWSDDDATVRQDLSSLFLPSGGEQEFRWMNELQRVTTSPENAANVMDAIAELDVSDVLPEVACPTLVLNCRDDRVAPIESGRRFAELVPGAKFIELDGENHLPLEGEPAFRELVDQSRAFIADVLTPMAKPIEPRAELCQASVAAIDIVSPLYILHADDPEASFEFLDPLVEIVCQLAESRGGEVINVDGGMITAVFRVQGASEDHTFQAARCALDARSAVEEASRGSARIRAAVDCGDIVRRATRTKSGNSQFAGPAVRDAPEIVRRLRGDYIVCTSAARAAIGGYAAFELLPRSDYSALRNQTRLFRITAENAALSRWYLRADQGLTELVGRTTELQFLADAWRAAREGAGRLVGVAGEPGLGKSRLVHEFLSSDDVTGFEIIEAGASEFDFHVSLHVIKNLLRSLCGIGPADPPDVVQEKVSVRIQMLGAHKGLETPLLFALGNPVDDPQWADHSATERLRQVQESVAAILGKQADIRPLAILIEDAHWIDSRSAAILERLVELIPARRMLVIVTYRPEFRHRWSRRSYFLEVRLAALGQSDTEQFVDHLLGRDPSLEPMRDMILDRGNGVPLFLEELVRELDQSGCLEGNPGAYVASTVPDNFLVPVSIKSVIGARIDRLDTRDRYILRIAAVIGKDVPLALLRDIAEFDAGTVDRCLERLKEAEFLFELNTFPDVELTFKHALTHEVAYAAAIGEQRRELHRQAMDAIERLYQDRREEFLERLAHHALGAEDWERAALYLRDAAFRAVDLSAYGKAAQFFDRAINSLDRLEPTNERIALGIDLRTSVRSSFSITGMLDAVYKRLDEALAAVEDIGDNDRLMGVLGQLSYLNSTVGRSRRGLEDAEELRQRATAAGDGRYVIEAACAAATSCILVSRAKEAIEYLAPVRDTFVTDWRGKRFDMTATRSVWYLALSTLAHAYLGEFDQADADAAALAEHTSETNRAFDVFSCEYFTCHALFIRGVDQALIDRIEQAIDFCRNEGMTTFECWLITLLGLAFHRTGDFDRAIDTLDEALETARRYGMGSFEACTAAIRTCARIARHEAEEPAAEIGAALEEVRQSGNPWIEVNLLADTARFRPEPEAEAALQQAIDICEDMGFRPDLVRTLLRRVEYRLERSGDIPTDDIVRARAIADEVGLEGISARLDEIETELA